MYILQNQQQFFLGKSGEWLDGREPALLFRCEFKDEALNQLFEANSRDHSLRIQLLECEANAKKHPAIPAEALPPLPLFEADPEADNSTDDATQPSPC